MHLAVFLLLLLAGRLVLFQGQLHPKHYGQGHAHHLHQAPGTGEGFSGLKITPGIITFALSFHHLMASQAPGGTMLPLEVSSHSRTQILEGLGFNLMHVSEFDSHQGFQNLLHTLYLPGNRLEICMGNALFLSSCFFQDSSRSPQPSMSLDSSAATSKTETQGRIVNLVSKLNASTTMMLVNYVYFKGVYEASGYPAPLVSSQQVTCFCLVLWMDYQGNITTLFTLPNRGKMEQVEEVLTPKMLTRWSNLPWKSYFYRKLKLYLPKFSISVTLVFCGLWSLQASLSPDSCFLSFRKAILEVGEVGTQAAVVTGTFWLNRLFLVVIFSANAQSILFLGKVVNPTKP
ncbi:hypothetical protein FD754_012417 [Muntiacus muntjak]|uniref:Serpin domain-containing protein n=1 Tax=Muntiacus muntjak TaxID=9888 RepID=A0A5N3VE73_MUNMU|nr:hypothetical protein FD754_012417 [Muntiacus muntjak]